jgi:hypothetical protein
MVTAARPTPSRRDRFLPPVPATPRAFVATIVAHGALGAAAWTSAWASTLYAVVTLLAAVVVVLRADGPDVVIGAVGYVAGAEALWRMTDAHVFWETGKYAVAALLVLALVRFRPGWRALMLPGLFVVLLVPGALVAIDHFGLSGAREPVSFNLAGPLAIALSLAFFGQVRVGWARFRRQLWPVVLPIVATATAVLIGTVEAGSIRFDGESNFATSGGFSPNQVAAVLGFGVLVCAVLAATEPVRPLRWLECALGGMFFAQGLMTLSRGGIANVLVAGALALLVAVVGRSRDRGRTLLVVTVGLAAVVVIALLVDVVSGGGLRNRYENAGLTNRDSIVRHDVELFSDEPVLGVGAGVARTMRPVGIRGEAAHTEFTRLLAEHGVFGLAALAILVVIVTSAFLRARPGKPRVLAAAFFGWATIQMGHSATRLALGAFAVGLAVAAAGLTTDDDATLAAGPAAHADGDGG